MCVCVCVCVCVRACVRAFARARAQYPAVHFCICSLSACVLESDLSLVMLGLLTTLVYLLKLLYIDSCVVGGRVA